MKHELKIYPPYFEAVKSGEKTFEIRQDDRGFQKGDIVRLREFDNSGFGIGHYTQQEITAKITYVTSFQQQPGWVVFGIKEIEK